MKPILGISVGDPAGIGPEITVKALTDKKVYDICRPIVVADAKCMEDALRITKSPFKLNVIEKAADAKFEYGLIDVVHLDLVDMSKLEYGKVSAMCGNAAFQCVVKVIDMAMKGEIDGTITGPLNKEAMNAAGHHYSGHTEIYADYTHTKDYTMMLADDQLRVVHVSTHVSLREACDRVKKDRVLKCITLANDACKKLGIESPKVAVAGLNPHAGENGMFGREEIEEITPAINAAREMGITVDGPVPPDTVFSKARGGMYDIVVCMYHDQGHIPLKVVGFTFNHTTGKWDAVTGVNITLGLPIVRSSVDHGTAFGKAGKGTANADSLVNAIEYGARLSQK